MARDRYKNRSIHPDVKQTLDRIISPLYREMAAECTDPHIAYGGRSFDDLFADTYIYILSDPAATACHTPQLLAAHFRYRFRMIRFQTIADEKTKTEITDRRNAHNQQTDPET